MVDGTGRYWWCLPLPAPPSLILSVSWLFWLLSCSFTGPSPGMPPELTDSLPPVGLPLSPFLTFTQRGPDLGSTALPASPLQLSAQVTVSFPRRVPRAPLPGDFQSPTQWKETRCRHKSVWGMWQGINIGVWKEDVPWVATDEKEAAVLVQRHWGRPRDTGFLPCDSPWSDLRGGGAREQHHFLLQCLLQSRASYRRPINCENLNAGQLGKRGVQTMTLSVHVFGNLEDFKRPQLYPAPHLILSPSPTEYICYTSSYTWGPKIINSSYNR